MNELVPVVRPIIPASPPLTPIPWSVIVYEGMRVVPSLLAEIIIGILMKSHDLSGELGLMAIMTVLAGQLYPKKA